MPLEKRSPEVKLAKGSLTGAPYKAKVVGHLDQTFQGSLEVMLLRDSGNELAEETQTYIVKYASPFYGVTSYDHSGKNVTYDDAQLSYGFWGMPPDVGVTGIVIFIDGKPHDGYWVACIQDKFQNHMIPAIGGTKNYKTDQDYEQGEHPLAVVEHNRKANEMDKNLEIDKIPRAVHPIAERIKNQGLSKDEFRGTSTSTARRDVPNMVFGMSTPGPLDRKGKKKFIGKRQNLTPTPVPVQRLGGSQLVFDDGDDRYYRKEKPYEGPPEYLKWIPNQLGDVDIPYNEHVRIRTRTGHQILLHNSEDFIYIGNARGTSWVQLSSDGKIDIFAADSVSVRTKQDFNFFCERDFNIEVGRNFNIKVGKEMHTHVQQDHVLIVDRDQKIHIKNRKDETINEQLRETVGGHVKKVYNNDYTHNVLGRMDWRVTGGVSFAGGTGSGPQFAPFRGKNDDGNNPCADDPGETNPVQDVNGPTPDRIDIKIYKDMRIEHIGVSVDHTIDGYLKTKIKGSVDINTDSTWKHTSAQNIEIKSGASSKITSAQNFEVSSGSSNRLSSSDNNFTAGSNKFSGPVYSNTFFEAPDFNEGGQGGAPASQSATATTAALPEDARTSAKSTIPLILKTHDMPDLTKQSSKDEPVYIDKIVRRMPTYETYPHHENLNPKAFKPEKTDRDCLGRYEPPGPEFPPVNDWRKYKKPGDNPF